MYLASPTKCTELRGEDKTGNGWFGASRGDRLHEGVDYVVTEGEKIYACCSGRARVGQVYAYSTEMKLVEIKGIHGVHNVRVKQMYINPLVKTGQTVVKGQLIGYAQNVAKFHNSEDMKPHVHITVYKNGLLTDPEPIIISN